MQIFDNQYHVLKYFVKPRMIDSVMLAHHVCLKEGSSDKVALDQVKSQKESGQKPNEVIPFVDAEFDYNKVKNFFEHEVRIMTGDEFDAVFQKSVKEGLIGDDMIPTVDGIIAVTDCLEVYEQGAEYLAIKAKDAERDAGIAK